MDQKKEKFYNICKRKGTTMKENNFETKMEELENVVTKLEKGDMSLDESLTNFEKGMKLSKECNKMLEDAEKKITILLENDGEIKEEDFESKE